MEAPKLLDLYLQLDNARLALELTDETKAEAVQDALNVLWYGLTPEEHGFLDMLEESSD